MFDDHPINLPSLSPAAISHTQPAAPYKHAPPLNKQTPIHTYKHRFRATIFRCLYRTSLAPSHGAHFFSSRNPLPALRPSIMSSHSLFRPSTKLHSPQTNSEISPPSTPACIPHPASPIRIPPLRHARAPAIFMHPPSIHCATLPCYTRLTRSHKPPNLPPRHGPSHRRKYPQLLIRNSLYFIRAPLSPMHHRAAALLV